MKKFVILALVMVLCLSVVGCGLQSDGAPLAPSSVTSGGDYPAAIMVDGTVYRMAYETAGEVDESAIIGHTTGYTDAYPTEDFHTNFSRETGLPVAKVSGGVAVLYENEWQLFTASGDVEIDAPDPWGITMEVVDLTPTAMTLVVTQADSAPTGEFGFGCEYGLEMLQDGVWLPVPYIPGTEDVSWTTELYIVRRGVSTGQAIHWENLYGELPEGQYRLLKTVQYHRGPGDRDERAYYAAFAIE